MMEQFGLSCSLTDTFKKGGKASILTASLRDRSRLLPLAVCRDPPAPQELILLCSVEQV